jgi:hypothetical protein
VTGFTIGANQIGPNPLFVNASTAPYDFHLQPGSPGINAGVTDVGSQQYPGFSPAFP